MDIEELKPAEEVLDETPTENEEEQKDLKEETSESVMSSTQESLEKIKQFTEEDDDKNSSSYSLRSILGGEFLTAKFVHDQIFLILLIAACFILYINNRYMNQQELIDIDNLKKELDEARFRSLTRSSELTAKSRQSYIEDFLSRSQDSLLQISTNSPYVIKLNGESKLPEHTDEHLTLEELKNLPDSIID